ncbi:hypothetical protein CAPTEDRAFT_172878 [Capitella teleta]|uniref:Bifunctional peptidase and (3S)-lysyl hydroxylase JMJD7 n=1 Tax=Capitella teleta TaxID=283909 RepID=R7UXC8_CAPTE|nr:hypothetical protein CAPTEDRAFT_172878 [Capitella teleta]|eukprot:ELU10957.1 hypothetical protein CAPTEDRAFT_172878 [Capitella teleta]
MDIDHLEECFEGLVTESGELFLDLEVPRIEGCPSPLDFLRKYVNANKPVIFTHAFDDWPALSLWDHSYLRSKIGSEEVTVTVTPNGYADAVCGNRFVMPEERRMTFGSFLDVIERKYNPRGVFYVQKQNSNFTDEFQSLMSDAPADIPWASEALGKKPDAVNFWIGDERAVTSMHKDHYENLYCVIRGQKTFTMHPPTDQPFIPYEKFQAAVYKEEGEQFVIKDDDEIGMVPWVAIDPLQPDFDHYPSYAKSTPVTVTVKEGEMLYLPSLWFHHVQQSHGCIAVNYWYDMEYDIKYAYFKFVENMLQKIKDPS